MTSWAENAYSISTHGHDSARDGIVLQHRTLVNAIAAGILRKLPLAIDLNDLIQSGMVGLLYAVETYDASRDADFEGYAEDSIKSAIMESLQPFDWAPRLVRRPQGPSLSRGQINLKSESGRTSAERGLGNRSNATRPRSFTMQPNIASRIRITGYGRRGMEAKDCIAASPDSRPDEICERNELRLSLMRAIERLPQGHRKVLMLHYGNDMTTKEISGLLGVSRCRISQIRRKALSKLSTALQTAGFAPPMRLASGGRAEFTAGLPRDLAEIAMGQMELQAGAEAA